jgi:hypothetical protein
MILPYLNDIFEICAVIMMTLQDSMFISNV